MGWFQQLLSPAYMPHGFCYLWNPRILWLHVISDGLIALSYYCIPLILIYFIRKNRNLPFNHVFWMFGSFILACGTTHVLEIWNVWHGDYLLAGVTKALTAAVSVLTTAMLIPMVPRAILLPSQMHLQAEEIGARERAEVALKESLASSESALKELADQKFALDQHAIVAVTDIQGTITYVNDKFCAISQYFRGELIGQNHRLLNSGHHHRDFFRHMYRTIANGEVWRGEIKNRAKDGSIYWVDTTIVPFMGANGRPRQYVAIRADITERKRAEEAREWLAGVIDSCDDAIISKTITGTITGWNRGAIKLFGYTTEEAVGKPMLMLVPPDRVDEERDILARIGHSQKVDHFETVRVRKDGRTVDVSVTISPIKDGSGTVVGASKIARDITERKHAEELLRQSLTASEEALKELENQKFALDQHAIVAITDVQGTITYVNEKFCAISQYSRHELIGQNHRILNSGHHPKEFFQQMYHTIANGKVWHGEIKNRAKEGSIYWVDTTIVPYLGENSKPRQYVAIRADITERKRVEETLREQAQVMDSAQVFVRDMQSRVVFWPRGAEQLYGFTSKEASGIISHDLFHTQFPEPLETIEKRLFETGVWKGELIHRKRDGCIIVVSSAWVLHRDSQGRPVRILETNSDITQRKAAERQIQVLNDELEIRVLERTAQLEAANKELEAFSYSVSHDLRAPLRHISGFSQMLVEELGTSLNPNAQRYLDRIQAGTLKMGLLVDELLNLAGVGRHTLKRRPVELNAIVAEVIAMLESEGQGRQVDWAIENLPTVACDAILVKQVFQNLLANALKFTRPRTRAVIEVGELEKGEDGQRVFMVRDNGIGFSMKYVDKLFGVFQRLHLAADFEGTGIGLATVQRVAQKHGGRAWAEGEVDKGAAFYFTLGLEKETEPKSNGATAGGQT